MYLSNNLIGKKKGEKKENEKEEKIQNICVSFASQQTACIYRISLIDREKKKEASFDWLETKINSNKNSYWIKRR
jgi:hypothetical protein